MNISLSLQSLENDNMTIKGEATVVKHTGSHYLLAQLPEWKLFPAVLRGKIRLKGSTATNPVAVGDKVTFEGVHYVSLIDNNTWSPADYPQGWEARP
jgi:hypothetical protein